MKSLTLFLIFFVSVACVNGQTTFKQNDIYLEVGGSGLFSSINYERQLTKQPGLGIRLGVGFTPIVGTVFITMPAGINYLFKLKDDKSFIDAGINLILFSNHNEGYWDGESITYLIKGIAIPNIGYRRHTTKNLMWRISFTPVITKESGFSPWGGISIGKRF